MERTLLFVITARLKCYSLDSWVKPIKNWSTGNAVFPLLHNYCKLYLWILIQSPIKNWCCIVPECTITAVWQASNNNPERCEICRTESYDGLHVPWRSEHISGSAGRAAEGSWVAADQGPVGQQAFAPALTPCARAPRRTPAQGALTTATSKLVISH